jgi:hypothetical protein
LDFVVNGQRSSGALVPNHLAAAGQDYPPHARGFGSLQNVVNANYIGSKQILDRVPNVVGRGGKMHQGGNSVHCATASTSIHDVANDSVIKTRRCKTVQSAHGMAARKQFPNRGLANVACRASDENGGSAYHKVILQDSLGLVMIC